jgi:hypothetical protein
MFLMIRPVRTVAMVCGSAVPAAVIAVSLCSQSVQAGASTLDPDGANQPLQEPLALWASPASATDTDVDPDANGDGLGPAMFDFHLPASAPASGHAAAPMKTSASPSSADVLQLAPTTWNLRLTKARLFRLDARQNAPLPPQADQDSEVFNIADFAQLADFPAHHQEVPSRFFALDNDFGMDDLARLPAREQPTEPGASFRLMNNPPLTLRAPMVQVYQSPRQSDHGLTPLTPGTSIWKLPLSDTLSLDGRGWQRQIDQDISVLVVGAEARVGLSERVDLRMGYELLRSASDSLSLSSEGEGEGVYAQFRFRF